MPADNSAFSRSVGTLGMESEASSSYGMVNGNGSVFDDSDSFLHADPSQQSDVSHSHQESSDMIGRDEGKPEHWIMTWIGGSVFTD